MKCIIVEDQPPAQRVLQKYIKDIGTIELLGTFTDALQAIEFLRTTTVDLIFLDIHLPKLSGIDFLKTLGNPPPVILTTAFPDFALESYELNVVDYLLKPFSFARFIKAVSKLKQNQPVESATEPNVKAKPNVKANINSIYIKSGHEYHKVMIEDIISINSDRDYTELHTDTIKYLSSHSLKHWEDTLSECKFVRVHKSYLVNENKITKITSMEVELIDRVHIPIGRAFKKNLDRILGNF
ncbi:MAG: DNA-binding LytR/AlgR family response regulator [Saprospiraceae bacterium]|jgi:DNA-binding LytR/AlgR family response regulator